MVQTTTQIVEERGPIYKNSPNKYSGRETSKNTCYQSQSRGQTQIRQESTKRSQSRSKEGSKNKSPTNSALRNGCYNTQQIVRFKTHWSNRNEGWRHQGLGNQGGSSNAGQAVETKGTRWETCRQKIMTTKSSNKYHPSSNSWEKRQVHCRPITNKMEKFSTSPATNEGRTVLQPP